MSIQGDRCCLSVCHETGIVKYIDTVITTSFMLLHPIMSLSQFVMGRHIYLYGFLVKCEVRSLILQVKPDFFSALAVMLIRQ